MSDLIERDKAIEAIENVDWYHQNRNKDMVSGANDDEHQAWYKADDIYKALESIPSARQQGDWISEGRVYPPTNGYHGAVCSICGTESEYLTNFCGECGADMRKDEPQTECDNDCPYRVDGLGCMRLGGCYKESE